MLPFFRLSTLLLATASSFVALDARAQGVVIERAPEPAQPPSADETAALRAENRRLARELDSTRHAVERLTSDLSNARAAKTESDRALAESTRELATLRARMARLEAQPPIVQPSAELQQNLAHAQAVANDLAAKNRQLHADLDARTAELRGAQADLATAETRLKETAATASSSNASTTARTPQLTADTTRLQQEKSDLEIQLAEARASEASLRQKLAASPGTAQPLPASPPAPDLIARLDQAENKLSTVLRSFTQLQTENDRLKSAAADTAAVQSDLQAARDQVAALEAQVTELSSRDIPPQFAERLAAAEDKLTTTLRSFSLLQSENDRLKTQAAATTEQANATASAAAAESAAQISALFDELRHTKAQVAVLAAENSELKLRAALAGSPPGSILSSPSRPGGATPTITPPTAPLQPGISAPTDRTHVVVPGDTLGGISRQYYGTPNRWEEILRANSDTIQNENSIPIGTTLRIP